MVVCKYFLNGNCRFGANCRFEHPQNTGGQNANQNRFGALGGQNSRSNDGRKDLPWAINITDVKNDMTAGQSRPQWIFSTYGPGRAAPASLLEDNEYSCEELRLRFYELATSGNEAQANQEAGVLYSKAESGMQAIAQNADDVIKFMEDAEQKHPNRYDLCQMDGTKTKEEFVKATESASSGFGGGFGQPANSTAFGKPAFGQPSTTVGFGQSSFSQPAQPANPFAQPSAASTFGKPAFGQSTFGQPSQPATGGFGQPSQPSSFGAPSFGQPTQQAPAFGQPSQPTSTFGQPSQPTATFGQPAQQTQSANPFAKPSPGFGQPSQPVSAFGQPTQAAPAFGQPSQPTASTFGQPAAPSGFGQSGFGQPSQPTSTGFGQPASTGFGQPANTGFGRPSQPAATGFGQPSQPAATGFGQPSQPAAATGFGAGTGFGASSTNTSPFIQPAATTATGGFGQPSNPAPVSGFGNPAPASTGFGAAVTAQSAQTPNPLTGQLPAPLHYTETIPKRAAAFRPGTKEVTSYAGRRVQYIHEAPCYERSDGKGYERIWFPEGGNGPDVLALNAAGKKDDLEGKAEDYTEAVKEAYVHLFTKGGFGDKCMPAVPPMREWCAFDF